MAKKSTTDSLKSKLAQSLDSANEPKSTSSSSETNDPMSASHATVTLEPTGSRKAAAQSIVNTSTILGTGAGALPLPGWDIAVITGVQLKMLADISAVYGVPFKENLGKSAVSALVGGLAPGLLARAGVGAFFKTLPGIGSIMGAITLPALAGGATYAVGQVFIKHYESGGTLLSFDAKDFRSSFTDEVKAGMKKVAEVKI